MAICSSSEIGVDVLHVGLDFVSKFVDHSEGEFSTDWSGVCSLEVGVLVIDIHFHGGWR